MDCFFPFLCHPVYKLKLSIMFSYCCGTSKWCSTLPCTSDNREVMATGTANDQCPMWESIARGIGEWENS